MSGRVLFIGLDAVEATLIDRSTAEPALPYLSRLTGQGYGRPLETCVDLFPGAVWFELASGQLTRSSGRYYQTRALRTGEARLRPLSPSECGRDETFWHLASAAGRRVAVLDMPHSVLDPALEGVQIVDWGGHDRLQPVGSTPPGAITDVRRRFGDHPVADCDLYPQTPEGYRRLRRDLLAGIERKTALARALMREERWDMFALAFGEGHCAGHHFWHFIDPQHPDHDPAAADDVRGALVEVYRALDRAVQELHAAAGRDVTVVVATSHGMTVGTGGYQLVPEMLARLGLSSGNGAGLSGAVRALHTRAKRLVPRRHAGLARGIARMPGLSALQARTGCHVDPFAVPSTRAGAVPNNRVGAVRLNLQGREPWGCVAPGPEAERLLTRLQAAFLELEDPATGTPIVERVLTIEEALGAGASRDLPDLLVLFRSDVGPIEACRSPRVGTIRVPLHKPRNPRTGDHNGHSRLWMVGPGAPRCRSPRRGRSVDVAPTVLSLLGVAPPPWMDGRSLSADVA